MSDEKKYEAVVEKIIRSGKHGPYAVARNEELDVITFALSSPVWQEQDWPEPGTCVELSQIRKKRAGWRAQRGRFVRPSDNQQTTTSNRNRREQGE